jgi:integrase
MSSEASMSIKQWVRRWKMWIAPAPVLPGVWPRKEGGFLVRARVRDPRTGKLREVQRVMTGMDAPAAYGWLQAEVNRIRSGGAGMPKPKIRWSAFAVSLLERKVELGEIRSAAGREKWGYVLEHHLIPAFGDYFVDQIRYADVEAWRTKVAARVRAGKLSPSTVNDCLGVMRVVMKAAVLEHELTVDPMLGIKNLDTSEHATYTEEEPNALTVDQVRKFLEAMRTYCPEHYAMTVLGFATGLRPSSLRTLRRSGLTPDVLWDDGVILVRRSHTRKQEVMNRTKTGKQRPRIELPAEVMEILRWHVQRLPEGPMQESELLFPSRKGGFRSRSVLDKPFDLVSSKTGLKINFTPRGMRRTFKDLARDAEVKDIVERAISGHQTDAMHERYQTVRGDEVRRAVAQVISLAGLGQGGGGNGGGKAANDGSGSAAVNE